ncbi:MAG TPA: hydroxymethylbilane synthase [Aeromicrobium sp.]|nr:hydroxymethylbilane synthase [Aeromicrobium sp.]
MVLRIGTRASKLAMTQTEQLAQQLRQVHGIEVELVKISTEGDRSSEPLASMGGTGVFVAAVRDAVLDGTVDLAVHSLKDLPTQSHPGLLLAAIPARQDPRDVVVARDGLTLGELPAGSRVGTGSPRRVSQLNALGLGVEPVQIRGNVDTRLGLVGATEGGVDAVLLAYAGLLRLSRADVVTEVLDPLQMLPAPGQGALACECRIDDDATAQLLAVLDDPDTRDAVTAERTLLATLEAGCSAPVGALAEVVMGDDGDELWLRAVVGDISGAPSIRRSATGSRDDAVALGARLAAELLEDGADQIMASEGVAS